MTSAEIREAFLAYFEGNGHARRASSSLVPASDPTLLFTNAGMVQFKGVFQGEEQSDVARAVTSQKCLRVSGKHNDLEEVGVTARHHTFFEMLGNFSFGDYFKRGAIDFAWELITRKYGIPEDRLWVTVHHTDEEAAGLWQEIAGLPEERVFRLGDKDNFWQMGDTGPCGPCSEIHFDLRAGSERGTDLEVEEFEVRGERGEFLELWNLVFMQFDRSEDGTLTPLPAPSIDTGAGLERLTSVLQGVESNYDTDLFTPLIARAARVVGREYDPALPESVSYRVLADHARAVAFLLADGVFPSNEGRGYVLRRILRRAVRHAWLLGRREPTLVDVVDEVTRVMGDAYPELPARRDALLRVVTEEEERFLDTIDSGMARIAEVAPDLPDEKRAGIERGETAAPVIAGEDAFRLHDTFGFPLDLTELIARERGYSVDVEGFESALEAQRERSRQDRKMSVDETEEDELEEGWSDLDSDASQEFVGYTELDIETDVIGVLPMNGRAAMQLRRNPFYVESGGQISDTGVVEGPSWRLAVDGVRNVNGRASVVGRFTGSLPTLDQPFPARASVARRVRRDTQRNHTATHLLHAALREELGPHVVQRGSLVAPDRLRFDFAHTGPMTPEEISRVESAVNVAILDDHAVVTEHCAYRDAVERGAMALFGEKYGDIVRTVQVPGISLELCGGTHVSHTGEIGLFRITSETGVAAGVRRIEAVTGSAAYERSVEQDALIARAASVVKAPVDGLLPRLEQLVEENRSLRRQVEKARESGAADVVADLIEDATAIDGARIVAREIEASSPADLRALGDKLRERLGTGAAVLAARLDERVALIAIVTDDLLAKGVRADQLMREIAALTDGSGGGRPHMAQGGAGDATKVGDALGKTADIIRSMLETR